MRRAASRSKAAPFRVIVLDGLRSHPGQARLPVP
ncbi:hypothetical protein SUDANB9_03340 [Streptomyces sp. enrichment culture]